LDAVNRLDERHPYRKLGPERITRSLDWYLNNIAGQAVPHHRREAGNSLIVTPAGLAMPVRSCPEGQATFDDIDGKAVALVGFEGHLDLPLGLISQSFAGRGVETISLRIKAPAARHDSPGIARAFDDLERPEAYFGALEPQLPKTCQVVLFPAVLGLTRNREVIKIAEETLGRKCFEVPTLPPSVPGMRGEVWACKLLQKVIDAIPEGPTEYDSIEHQVRFFRSRTMFALLAEWPEREKADQNPEPTETGNGA
jgi:glycerol-3-phosphate dehydrogenase subunit B